MVDTEKCPVYVIEKVFVVCQYVPWVCDVIIVEIKSALTFRCLVLLWSKSKLELKDKK